MLTWRGLNNVLHGKGSCDLFVGQLELREYLFAKVVPYPGSKSYENGNSYAHSFCFSIHVILVSTASADFHLGDMVGHRMW